MKVRKLMLGVGALATSLLFTPAANAYYVITYLGPPYGEVSGAELYCDDGTLLYSGGIITGVIAYIDYHPGEAPC